MPKTKRRPGRTRKATTAELAKELRAVKAEVERLREQWAKTNRTLLRLCRPEKWFEEEIDEKELWSQAVWDPPLCEGINKLR
jgi:chromosome segregation ATPase